MATIYGNSGNNNLTGTATYDFIYGYDGNDTLTGLAGNDLLDGGTGTDTMIGGAGDDIYIVDSLSDVITELPGQGVDTIKTSLSYTLAENYVNNLTLTGNSNLNGTGNSYDNVITGNSLNNILDGKAGKDTLIGGIGDDTYLVDSTTDVIVELAGQGVDTVISSVSYTLAENYINNLTLSGSYEISINGTGNSYDNIIYGNDGDNVLKGGDGNDSIYAQYGDDTLYGERGNDFLSAETSYGYEHKLLDGGDGNDTLEGGYGIRTLYGGKGNDVLIGIGNSYDFEVYGIMFGGEGNDTLGGYEEIYGESGNDSLTIFPGNSGYGGLGNDTITFYNDDSYGDYRGGDIAFNTPNEGTDTIINFESVNRIGVSASGFGGGLTQYSNITDAQFKYGSSATTATQRFLYDTSTGYLRFDVDGNGSAAATVFAIFQGAPTLTNNDIYVF